MSDSVFSVAEILFIDKLSLLSIFIARVQLSPFPIALNVEASLNELRISNSNSVKMKKGSKNSVCLLTSLYTPLSQFLICFHVPFCSDEQAESSDPVSFDASTPILVITYKNHALDSFLKDCLHFTRSIVRVGGRSECEELKDFTCMPCACLLCLCLILHSAHCCLSFCRLSLFVSECSSSSETIRG